MASTIEEANELLEKKQGELQTAAEMGKMLLEKCDTMAREQAALQAEIDEVKKAHAESEAKASELETKNGNLQARNEEYARIVKELEAETEGLRDEAGSQKGDASNAARRAKAELEVKCRELTDQVDVYRAELETAKNEIDTLTKAKERLKTEKDDLAGKLQESEGRSSSMEESLKQKDAELRSQNKSAGDDAQGEVRSMKEKMDGMFREIDMMRKQITELQDVNNILNKQHEDDQTLLEDVKATNMMLREALETKELEWGTSDSNLASFAPKESLLGEIEQHFNRFQTFGSPQRGSSKMPNFMDVVKRDFENLAMRIHRLRQKMEKKWPEPPPGSGSGPAAPAGAARPAAAPAAEPATAGAD